MKKIITYGTFDLFHVGHVNILKRAKELGDYLVVGLSTDEFNSLKGKQSYYPYSERKLILEAIKYVDEVIPEENWEQKVDDIKKHNIDVLVMGDDWEGSDRFNYLKEYVELIFLPRTENISTSKIKYELQNDKDKK
ncbi:MAG: glycerol-3-phosphate cytidylyltransferase [Bacilli bacterium]|nr:glycerol-3-phosphate cytidylyltransferase [Bacilli bacterium]